MILIGLIYVFCCLVTKYLPAIPVPPRSVLIKRYPTLPERPRKILPSAFFAVPFFCNYLANILIERWLPYGPRPDRETIIYPAPPAPRYPEPSFKIIQYHAAHTSIRHRLEKFFYRENPEHYRARYGSSLLDSATLIQRAREAGVDVDLVRSSIQQIDYTEVVCFSHSRNHHHFQDM